MSVQRFYPWTMKRSWAVMQTNGRPHSLWIHKADAEEMEARLAEFSPIQRAYRPMNTEQEEQDTWQR
jgi:hypothetical protein